METSEDKKQEQKQQRSCVACREQKTKSELVRLVVSPDNLIELDFNQQLTGRGAYLCPNYDCFFKAEKSGGFNRSFKRKCVFQAERLWNNLLDAAFNRLLADVHLVRKAGGLIHGGNNVEAGLRSNRVKLVVLSEDASDNTKDKFSSSAKARNLPVLVAFEKENLGESLNKGPCSVMGITLVSFVNRLLKDSAIYNAAKYSQQCRKTR